MRFLSINHPRLGSRPAGIPSILSADNRTFATRYAWSRAVSTAIQQEVHAVLLTGEVFAASNTGLEPWGPLLDGLADLRRAGIPVVCIAHGEFNPRTLARFATDDAIIWLETGLDWDPPVTTSMNAIDGPAVHVINGSLAESMDAPAQNPVTLESIDHPDSIWILTAAMQPDVIRGEHALIVEPGALAPLFPDETGRHGAWLIDTETAEAALIPLATLEHVSIDLDISSAEDLDTLEQLISASLVRESTTARNDGSMAETMLVDLTLTGTSRLYPALADTLADLQPTLVIDHDEMAIAISHVTIDATPSIDIEALLGRPDPVGEVARLIQALTEDDLNEQQARLLTATEQKLLAVSHARVFGSILDDQPETDAPTLLLRQSWATLDALVRQRGID